MKRLTSITATNFKGLTFTTPLSPATLLVGANFAGKTARTDAIRLLLLGHLPELGKNNKDSMGLASAREMAVEGSFEDGTAIRRAFRMKGDAVSKEEDVPKQVKDCGQIAVMLNAEEYFALGDRARVDYVFANCPGEGMVKIEEIVRRVFAPAGRESLLKAVGPIQASTTQAFIEDAMAKVKEAEKASKAFAVIREHTIQGLAGMRAGDDQAQIAASLTQLDAKRTDINAEVRVLDERRAKLKADQDQRDKVARRHEAIAREFAVVDVDAKRARAAELKDELTKLVVPQQPSIEVATALRKKEMDLNGELGSCRTNYRNTQSLHAVSTKELADIDGKTTCPYCGASGEGWKDAKRREIATDLATYADVLKTQEQLGIRLKEDITAVQFKIGSEERAAQARAAALAEQARIGREINDLEVTLSRLSALAEERANLGESTPADPSELVAVGHKLSQLQSELNDIETQRRAAMGRQHELGRLAQAEEERDKAKAEAEAAKAAADELRVIQGEMVEAAFKPLLERANRIFGDVLRSPLAYREGEIGTWRGGAWVGHRTFSGTEKALAYAAIQAALTSASPVRVMILDELGRLDAWNKFKTIERAIVAIYRGDIDQFIGIDAGSEADACEKFACMIKKDGSGLNVVAV